MGKVHQIGNVIIRIWGGDHLPPHFHIIAPDFEAAVEIDTMTVIVGILPKAGRPALEWARQNKVAIIAEWNRTNPRFPL
ncbi:DUF4160 domain-containing protein [Ancylobacter defluvii]|uniref:DUF4160 domain-containing protein n=1 Tax=Ancylobacter defluvii TaxID=1282440 RepID=A0A9W6K283_9HYPH|nr:DUF4160 domain-containing protein [Ancylobacter defluvii]MBS7588273.1 DUF4160 domain-containing protein [Ancylobacter defluvii]GLK86669.1 hypothetical protein GCM10017653_47390 [Ancylobacter defluvii]